MRVLVAAAVPRGTKVRLEEQEYTVTAIRNSDPVVGKIVWVDEKGGEHGVSAARNVEILELPK